MHGTSIHVSFFTTVFMIPIINFTFKNFFFIFLLNSSNKTHFKMMLFSTSALLQLIHFEVIRPLISESTPRSVTAIFWLYFAMWPLNPNLWVFTREIISSSTEEQIFFYERNQIFNHELKIFWIYIRFLKSVKSNICCFIIICARKVNNAYSLLKVKICKIDNPI